MRMLQVVGWVAVVTACGFPRPPSIVGDAQGDSSIDMLPDAQLCFGTDLRVCLAVRPTQPFFDQDAPDSIGLVDTTNSPLCAETTNNNDYCVIAATDIVINVRFRATGTRPLVLLATGAITTGAGIDVSSRRGQTPETGAGADPAQCASGTLPGPDGGGAGGNLAGFGGAGGAGSSGGSGGSPAPAMATMATLRGGCPGQDGQGTQKGLKGHGGGAVMLIAGDHIDIRSDILAGGEGGEGGGADASGGGGGGAGGMIVLDAPTITGNSQIIANGGGGGEGGNASAAGDTGVDGSLLEAAPGGHGGLLDGGDGGDGSAGAASGPGLAGSAGRTGGTGGGGGGGGG
ncbi:MAG TPA: hypothetical protein VHW23_38950, partial [Kofleriaceae bacterium]|nr:hypothetical protein [Kofleriaceae bacterium]